MELKFCPLFSGSSGNALYVACGQTQLLVDAGLSGTRIAKELQAAGGQVENIDGILITHEHSDHVSGVGVLSRKYDLPIYAAEKTWAAMAKKLGAVARKNVRMFEPDQDFYIGEINIMPFRTPHDAADPVGFSFRAGGCKLSVATDLGCVRETWLREVEGSDLVLLESNHDIDTLKAGRYPYELKHRILGNKGHLSNDDAGAAAVSLVKRGTKSLILGHLSKENNFPELAYESVALALREADIAPGADVYLSVARRDGRSEMFTIRDGGAGADISRGEVI